MKTIVFGCALGALAAAALMAGIGTSKAQSPETVGAQNSAREAFRDSTDTAPPNWVGPKFKLNYDYPKTQPSCDAPWLKRQVSFSDASAQWSPEWQGYVQDIVNYVKQGQDPNLPNNPGWQLVVDGQTRWFHVPWMAFDGERGREFVHGLTNELSTARSTFRSGGRGSGKHLLTGAAKVNGVDPLFETWSVGMYNPCGAWALGQMFQPSGVPATYKQDGRTFARGLPFPEGTVVMKILTTTASESAVPYLKDSPTWQADGHVQTGPTAYMVCQRQVRDVHLVQIDLAVVDSRSPTRWVYSTLAYDGTLPGNTVWDRLRPLGVQWGNDPGTFPAVPTTQSKPPYETILAPVGIAEHYGCGKRLAGAVDQANSSCVSCHMGAYAAEPDALNVQGDNIPAIFVFGDMCNQYNYANSKYFSNYKYPASYPSGQFDEAIPLDSSLQVAVAFAQYGVFKNSNNPQNPKVCPNPLGPENATPR